MRADFTKSVIARPEETPGNTAEQGAEQIRTAVSALTHDLYDLVFAWGNNPVRTTLKDRRCRVIARGSRLRSVLVEFEDGTRVVTSARAVRHA